jgi:DNA-binding response OmpR family regulator
MSKGKILIVDDEPELVKAIQIRLESSGYEVTVARDGQEGLDKIKSERPSLVILDVMLPKLDGYKVCRLLKFDEKYKNIPVIMLTARAQESDAKLSAEVGADAYVTKPFDHRIVLSKIQELLKT